MRTNDKLEGEAAYPCDLPPKPSTKSARSAIGIANLDNLNPDTLRSTWTSLYGIAPLPHISRELLIRACAYRIQEQARGGLSVKLLKKMDAIAREHEAKAKGTAAPAKRAQAGTRLIREWQGRMHEVVVLEDSYLWNGSKYDSLSEIARLITGTRWSGPRFFGTKASKVKTAAKVVRSPHV